MVERKIYDIPHRNPEDDPYREVRETARKRMVLEAKEKCSVTDLAHEAEISRRLDALGEPYKTEFLRIREESIKNRREDEVFSQQEIDIFNLEAMERSAAYRR